MSVRLQRAAGQALSAVSVSADQRFAATGCGSHVEIIALRAEGARDHVTMQMKSDGHSSIINRITDVMFAPHTPSTSQLRVAASGTNGMVAVFDLSTNSHTYSCLWDSGESQEARSVNSVSWKPDDSNVLVSSGMDGLVKLYDLRLEQEQRCVSVFNPRSDAARDVVFDPFDPLSFAVLTENGYLTIWDSRYAKEPHLKISAHTSPGLALAWNPTQRGIIASGSRDKTVKVWDVREYNIGSNVHENISELSGASTSSVGTSSAGAGAGAGAVSEKAESSLREAMKLPIHVIQTPNAVGCVRWRCGAGFVDQLATASQNSEMQGGEIFVWNLSMSNTPACVLKGHTETCSDFQWLDTPVSDLAASAFDTSAMMSDKGARDTTATATAMSSHARATAQNGKDHSKKKGGAPAPQGGKQKRSGNINAATRDDRGANAASRTTGTTGSTGDADGDGEGDRGTAEDGREGAFRGLGVYQHILSVGKDGQLLVQDVRNAFFPRQHMSSCVTAISSQGHVAFQRGKILRSDPIGMVSNAQTKRAATWYSDAPEHFGMLIPGKMYAVAPPKVPQVAAPAPATAPATAAAATTVQAQVPVGSVLRRTGGASTGSTDSAAVAVAAAAVYPDIPGDLQKRADKDAEQRRSPPTNALSEGVALVEERGETKSAANRPDAIGDVPALSSADAKSTRRKSSTGGSSSGSGSSDGAISNSGGEPTTQAALSESSAVGDKRGTPSDAANGEALTPDAVAAQPSAVESFGLALSNGNAVGAGLNPPSGSTISDGDSSPDVGAANMPPRAPPAAPLPLPLPLPKLTSVDPSGATIACAEVVSCDTDTGAVIVGLAKINALEEAREIRKELQRGAEGGVFDPAVISLLAVSYQVGYSQGTAQYDAADTTQAALLRVTADAVAACVHNMRVAYKAGLQCRSGIWAVALSCLGHQGAGGGSGSGTSQAFFDDAGILPASTAMLLADGACANPISGGGGGGGCSMPSVLPFEEDILGCLLQDLVDIGDCQHFVVLCEVLKHARLLEKVCRAAGITDMQRREIYFAYFELLGQLELFTCVNAFLKDSDEDYFSRLSRQGVSMHTACAQCGKQLREGSIPWCAKCARMAAMCSLCQEPVCGLMHWCPVCGHGGHTECLQLWFKDHFACPSGCGHDCCDPADRDRFVQCTVARRGSYAR